MEAEDFNRLVMTPIVHRRAVSVYEYTAALSMAIRPHDPLKIKWLISCKDSKLDSFVYLGHSNSIKQLDQNGLIPFPRGSSTASSFSMMVSTHSLLSAFICGKK